MNKGRAIDILLVEDNPADVRLTREALKDAKVSNTLHVVGDGVEAMDFLQRKKSHTSAVRPDLILLDLNLPRKNGKEVLADIKSDEDLRSIPVVILTTSRSEEDVMKTYRLHANCFITKPVDLAQFVNVVRSIDDFWFSIVRLPTE